VLVEVARQQLIACRPLTNTEVVVTVRNFWCYHGNCFCRSSSRCLFYSCRFV